jgi:hypothetical protein
METEYAIAQVCGFVEFKIGIKKKIISLRMNKIDI